MKKLLVICFIAAFLLIIQNVGNSSVAQAGSYSPSLGTGFRCGNLLMSEGVDKLQVLANCGQPVASEKSWIDQYGEVERLVYGPISGYYNILYFFAGKLIKIEEVRQ